MKPNPVAVEIAKRDGLHLVTLSIIGKHAKKDSVDFDGPMGPETTAKVWEFLNAVLLDDKERMK